MVKGDGDSVSLKHLPFICRRIHESHPAGIFYGQNPLEYSFTVILLEISFITLIIHTLRILLRPLKQPRIVSELIGGIIIGPSVLGRDKAFRKHVFPDNASYVLKNIGLVGFIYFVFLSAVKMDLKVITKAGKKQYALAIMGVVIPIALSASLGYAMSNLHHQGTSRPTWMGGVASAFAITTFPLIYQVIRELNLLSSEMGKFTLSTIMISDLIGINCIVIFEAARLYEECSLSALWYLLSLPGLGLLIGGVRAGMDWVVRKTPEGHPVEEPYVLGILVAVLVVSFLSDITGAAILSGPLWLGLAVPDGPPLGATLVERAELIVTELFLPFSFAFVGMYTDISTIRPNWSLLAPLLLMALVAYFSKFITLVFVARLFKMPFRESITLGLMSSLRGHVEIMLFMHWLDVQMMDTPAFTILVVLVTVVTATVTPLISIIYDPTRPYMVNKRRALQYTPPNTEIHIVASIHDQESVTGFINLLEISNPTISSPFSVYALRLIELVGRATTVFIDHDKQAQAFEYSSYNPIHNALKLFGESRGEYIKFHFFTSVSPKRTMFQDICELALVKKSVLIILPFKKKGEGLDARTEVVKKKTLRSVNSNVLAHAPCSVGILVDKGPPSGASIATLTNRVCLHHFVVLFLGGADSREALAYADRMASNPDVALTVIRFLAFNGEGDNEMEKKLDDGVVTWFWVKNEGSQRVVYKEVVVRNGEETIASIRAINSEFYDLWIVGRKQGMNPVLVQGLSSWSRNDELGVIGDYIAAMDLEGKASVLVMQQQILRGQEVASSSTSSLK